ncbi:hypothetical protein [Acinetobacter baumannii]|uniref:hypothetical protein n=1 Tax=Acinetobacter baumannii TaxID=470 RepID=UPI0022EADEE1|nr:hypothetical protein [Acinetobacter baumannii]MDA3432892.1 hypothetical protein [Acinetobacter baumannii]
MPKLDDENIKNINENFLKLKEELLKEIIELKKCEYIEYLNSYHKNNSNNLSDLIEKIESIYDYCSLNLNSPDELDLTKYLLKNINDLLSTAKHKNLEYIKRRDGNIIDILDEINNSDYHYYFEEVESLKSLLLRYKLLKESFDSLILDRLRKNIVDINSELLGFRRSKNILDNLRTETIYSLAVEKYKKLEKKYRKYFYRALPIVLFVAICMFLGKDYLINNVKIDIVSYWILKLSILTIGITVISYFLKQSIHYQKLADQNYQTQIELQAYPSFMESLSPEEAASVRKELALKYFGREIDGAAHKDMSNLISDQMKSTTDMVKATTEAIKNLK